MKKIVFSQTHLAKLSGLSPATISRVLSKSDIEPVESDLIKAKKYNYENSRKLLNELYASEKRPIHQQTQVFYNFKGGTGKTSLCFQVSTHLAILGFKILCIDLDPQGHLTNVLGFEEDLNSLTIYDVLVNKVPLRPTIVNVFEGLDLIPSNISLTCIEVPLNQQNKREEKLLNVLQDVKSAYDFILIDTNPTISTLNMNALVACDRLNIICETQPFSLSGLRVLISELDKFYCDMRLDQNYCIIPNKYESKTATAQEVLGALRMQYTTLVFDSIVRKAEDINIASKKKLPVSAFCKKSSSAFEDIIDLTHSLVEASVKQEVKKQHYKG